MAEMLPGCLPGDQDKADYSRVSDDSRRFGWPQSVPSGSMAGCAGVRNTLPSRADVQAAALQPFCQQAQAVTGGPEQSDLGAQAAAEDKDVTGHRVVFQRGLDLSTQTV